MDWESLLNIAPPLTFGFCCRDPLLQNMHLIRWVLLKSDPTFHHPWHDTWLILLLTNLHPFLKLMNCPVSPSVMAVVRFYSNEAVQGRALQRAAKLYPQLSITTELCYNVELTGECSTACQERCTMWRFWSARQVSKMKTIQLVHPSVFLICPCRLCFLSLSAEGCESLSEEQKEVLLWLFRPPLQAEPLSEKPNLSAGSGERLVEIGPRYCCTDTVE